MKTSEWSLRKKKKVRRIFWLCSLNTKVLSGGRMKTQLFQRGHMDSERRLSFIPVTSKPLSTLHAHTHLLSFPCMSFLPKTVVALCLCVCGRLCVTYKLLFFLLLLAYGFENYHFSSFPLRHLPFQHVSYCNK